MSAPLVPWGALHQAKGVVARFLGDINILIEVGLLRCPGSTHGVTLPALSSPVGFSTLTPTETCSDPHPRKIGWIGRCSSCLSTAKSMAVRNEARDARTDGDGKTSARIKLDVPWTVESSGRVRLQQEFYGHAALAHGWYLGWGPRGGRIPGVKLAIVKELQRQWYY